MNTQIRKSSLRPKNPNKVIRTVENPPDALLFDRFVYGNQSTVRCPVCGDSYSHVQSVYTLLGGDESEGLYRGSYLVARETDFRRDAIAVRVQGETCGHRWDVVFQQHKGHTFVRIDILEDMPSESPEAAPEAESGRGY
jgi:hypothetical protein